jgi:hypothetical protein
MPDSFPDFRGAKLPGWASACAIGAYVEACEVALLRFRQHTGRNPDTSQREDAEGFWFRVIEDLEGQADQVTDIADADFEREAADIRRLVRYFGARLIEVRNVVVPFKRPS